MLIKKLYDEAVIPTYSTIGAAGMDLRACLPVIKIIDIAPNDLEQTEWGDGGFGSTGAK